MQADNKQKAVIHILKAQLIKQAVIDEAGYKGLLMQWFDVESSKDLDYAQATTFIDDLIKMGGNIKKKPRKKLPPDITQLPSPQILAAIDHLRQDVKWRYPDGYQRWLKKYMGIERPRTMKEAMKIYEGLKAMRSRQQRASEPEATCYKDGYVRGNGRIQW